MVTQIKSDKIITPQGLYNGYIRVKDGKIAELSRSGFNCDESYDFGGLYVSAGFIDLHTHGGGGYAFINSTADDVRRACDFHLGHGTTSIMPTVSAAPFESMKKAVQNIARVMREGSSAAHIAGAHLEGPYLSAEQCGAQCPGFITPPVKSEYAELVREYGKYIARWTYAPECDKGGEFCKFITDNGIIASAGHSAATHGDMLTASANGCKLITHLYSCTSTVTRDRGFRKAGIIESAFLQDDMNVEIIADGKHLPPELINLVVKIKGEDRVALITDSLAVTGTNVREGVMSGTEFIIEDGVCKLRDRSAFAGSIATADECLRTLVNDCGISIVSAVKMLTATPAAIAGLKHKGSIKKGYDADLAVLNKDLLPIRVFAGGRQVI